MLGSYRGPVALLALLLGILPLKETAAQTLSFTPTFQHSLSGFSPVVPASEFQAFGFMLGLPRTNAWWQPNIWFQRYRIESYRPDALPDDTEGGAGISGWMLSVGPAIEFFRSSGFTGDLLPLVGLGSISTGDVNGGGGVHFGFDGGFFHPQLFARYQTLGSAWFWSVGVGMTFQVRWDGFLSGDSPWG